MFFPLYIPDMFFLPFILPLDIPDTLFPIPRLPMVTEISDRPLNFTSGAIMEIKPLKCPMSILWASNEADRMPLSISASILISIRWPKGKTIRASLTVPEFSGLVLHDRENGMLKFFPGRFKEKIEFRISMLWGIKGNINDNFCKSAASGRKAAFPF